MTNLKSNIKKTGYFIAYVPLYLSIKFINLVPKKAAVVLGKTAGSLLFLFSNKYRNIAKKNLSFALHLKEKEAKEMALSVFKNLGITFAEIARLKGEKDRVLEKDMVIEGMQNFLEAQERGKGVFLMSAHLGNWEMLAALHRRYTGPMTVIYKRTKNPYIDKYIRSIREQNGVTPISRRNSSRKIIATLRRGETVGILPDLHARNRQSVMADFFGRPAATNYGMALLAMKTGAPVVPAFVVRSADGTYKCIYEKPIYLQQAGTREKDVELAISACNSIIENYIRKYPEQWYWVNDRWKSIHVDPVPLSQSMGHA